MKIFSKPVSKLVLYLLVVFIVLNIAATAYLMWPVMEGETVPVVAETLISPTVGNTPELTTTNVVLPVSPTKTPNPTLIPPTSTPLPASPNSQGLREQGLMILSLADGDYFHLFAFHPQYLPMLRLTNEKADDINPSISPDGSKVAFSSKRSGYWDIYVLDMISSQITQMTNTPEFDGSPTWSPDGQWIAFESYNHDNLDIYLIDANQPLQQPLPLTDDKTADFSPSWMPGEAGRQIAFVSNRSGEADIWIARLDDFKQRFINLSRDSENEDTHPNWSPDGRFLAWAKKIAGEETLVIWDSQHPDQSPRPNGTGDWPTWNPAGSAVLARVSQANLTAITSYESSNAQIDLPLVRLPGPIQGLDWKYPGDGLNLAEFIAQSPSEPGTPLWSPVAAESENNLGSLVMLDGVSAPNPVLLSSVDDSYNALRNKVAAETGWDFLNSLESAFMEKNIPPYPGMGNSWLNTGRGIAINPLPMNSGWMILSREDIGSQVFWRVYLKTRQQDGSQGKPLTGKIWDILARNSGDPLVYENGGKLLPAPDGYWVDFTELANRYSWDRFPALTNWITYYPGSRYNLFAFTDNLDLYTALGQLYPGEDFARPAPRPTITPLPTIKPDEPTATPESAQ